MVTARGGPRRPSLLPPRPSLPVAGTGWLAPRVPGERDPLGWRPFPRPAAFRSLSLPSRPNPPPSSPPLPSLSLHPTPQHGEGRAGGGPPGPSAPVSFPPSLVTEPPRSGRCARLEQARSSALRDSVPPRGLSGHPQPFKWQTHPAGRRNRRASLFHLLASRTVNGRVAGGWGGGCIRYNNVDGQAMKCEVSSQQRQWPSGTA